MAAPRPSDACRVYLDLRRPFNEQEKGQLRRQIQTKTVRRGRRRGRPEVVARGIWRARSWHTIAPLTPPLCFRGGVPPRVATHSQGKQKVEFVPHFKDEDGRAVDLVVTRDEVLQNNVNRVLVDETSLASAGAGDVGGASSKAKAAQAHRYFFDDDQTAEMAFRPPSLRFAASSRGDGRPFPDRHPPPNSTRRVYQAAGQTAAKVAHARASQGALLSSKKAGGASGGGDKTQDLLTSFCTQNSVMVIYFAGSTHTTHTGTKSAQHKSNEKQALDFKEAINRSRPVPQPRRMQSSRGAGSANWARPQVRVEDATGTYKTISREARGHATFGDGQRGCTAGGCAIITLPWPPPPQAKAPLVARPRGQLAGGKGGKAMSVAAGGASASAPRAAAKEVAAGKGKTAATHASAVTVTTAPFARVNPKPLPVRENNGYCYTCRQSYKNYNVHVCTEDHLMNTQAAFGRSELCGMSCAGAELKELKAGTDWASLELFSLCGKLSDETRIRMGRKLHASTEVAEVAGGRRQLRERRCKTATRAAAAANEASGEAAKVMVAAAVAAAAAVERAADDVAAVAATTTVVPVGGIFCGNTENVDPQGGGMRGVGATGGGLLSNGDPFVTKGGGPQIDTFASGRLGLTAGDVAPLPTSNFGGGAGIGSPATRVGGTVDPSASQSPNWGEAFAAITQRRSSPRAEVAAHGLSTPRGTSTAVARVARTAELTPTPTLGGAGIAAAVPLDAGEGGQQRVTRSASKVAAAATPAEDALAASGKAQPHSLTGRTRASRARLEMGSEPAVSRPPLPPVAEGPDADALVAVAAKPSRKRASAEPESTGPRRSARRLGPSAASHSTLAPPPRTASVAEAPRVLRSGAKRQHDVSGAPSPVPMASLDAAVARTSPKRPRRAVRVG